jgi:hypothetical protein
MWIRISIDLTLNPSPRGEGLKTHIINIFPPSLQGKEQLMPKNIFLKMDSKFAMYNNVEKGIKLKFPL